MIFVLLFFFQFSNCLAQSDPDNFKILILHSNDVHARFEEVNKDSLRCDDGSHLTCFGGAARLRAAVDKYRAEAHEQGIPTLYLDAGDYYQGTVYYTEFKWHLTARMVNMLRPNVIALGNHEFDDKIAGLIPFLRQVKLPIVCCNLDLTEEPRLLKFRNLMPSKVLRVNGRKIGIIGYITPDISKRNRGNVKILDEITSIRKEAQKLKRSGVDILIALGHSGYPKDKQIALEVEELDLVVGGHSHTFLYTGVPPSTNKPKGPYPTEITQPSGKVVPVVQASAETKYLGYLMVEFDKEGNLVKFSGQPILLSGDLPRYSGVRKTLNPYSKIIATKFRKELGTTEVLLKGDSAKCKFKECNIGNMITDAFVEHVGKYHRSSKGYPMATVAVIHSGAIKASLHPKSDGYSGKIVLEDVMTVLPFASELVILRLPGSVLHEAIEHSVHRYTPEGTMFYAYLLQVSGLKISYDLTRDPGDRVVDVQVRREECDTPSFSPLEPEKVYGVVMPKFVAQGGDNYVMFKPFKFEPDLKVMDYNVVSEYVKEHSPITGYSDLDNRITITGD